LGDYVNIFENNIISVKANKGFQFLNNLLYLSCLQGPTLYVFNEEQEKLAGLARLKKKEF